MSHPLRENLEVHTESGGNWIRCTRCRHVLCPLGEDWRGAAQRRTFPPTKAGPLMRELLGRYLLEKLYCPSCDALLNSEMVERPPA